MNNIKKIICGILAVASVSVFATGCGEKTSEAGETTIAASESSSDENTSETSGSRAVLKEPDAVSESEDTDVEGVTWATVTDVENEVDRAIYKARIKELPDGWTLLRDATEGKYYRGLNNQSLMIQATNFGADAELTDLDTFADSVAANIKITNMYYQADTFFDEPTRTTVAGLDTVRYDYTVTYYAYKTDDDGNVIEGEDPIPFNTVQDRLYVLYNGTDAYILVFEADKEGYEEVSKEFDFMLDNFTIDEDGTEGYERASIHMSEFESFGESYMQSVYGDEYTETTSDNQLSPEEQQSLLEELGIDPDAPAESYEIIEEGTTVTSE